MSPTRPPWRSPSPPPGSAHAMPEKKSGGRTARRISLYRVASRIALRASGMTLAALGSLQRKIDIAVVAAARTVVRTMPIRVIMGDARPPPGVARDVRIVVRLIVGRDRIGVAGGRQVVGRALRHDVARLLIRREIAVAVAIAVAAARIAAAPAHRRAAIDGREARVQRRTGIAAAPAHRCRCGTTTATQAVAVAAPAQAERGG